VFTLTRAFGNQPNNGSRRPYVCAGPDDWWDENPAPATYNRLVISRFSPGGDSENLYYAGGAYAQAVVINYNTDPVIKGAGSAMFLHVGNGTPTTGCMAISARSLNAVMRWLDPTLHRVISIGVGAAARAILTSAP
jgi:L,D-peptidoglycan transpeptidase YkuD (ErfK/YbiS/YcfS/YnhG family)